MKLILAHKGIHYKYPENSLESIIDIFKYKSNKFNLGVEFDINLTKDNKLILFHDEMLNDKKINNLFYKEIKLTVSLYQKIYCNNQILIIYS